MPSTTMHNSELHSIYDLWIHDSPAKTFIENANQKEATMYHRYQVTQCLIKSEMDTAYSKSAIMQTF
jgi:hypothetical protein